MDTRNKETNQGGPDTSGPGTGQAAAPAGLGQLWRSWLATVERFAHQGRTRSRVDPQEYRILHRELIDTCRALARDPGNPKRELYEQMVDLVSPWLSVGTLDQADGEILNDLLFRCRQFNGQLVGRRWGAGVRRGGAWCLFVVLVAAGSSLVMRSAGGVLPRLLGWGYGKMLEARWAITRSDAGPWLFAGAFLVTVLAIYLVCRTARG